VRAPGETSSLAPESFQRFTIGTATGRKSDFAALGSANFDARSSQSDAFTGLKVIHFIIQVPINVYEKQDV
jgi:hypothetical protein